MCAKQVNNKYCIRKLDNTVLDIFIVFFRSCFDGFFFKIKDQYKIKNSYQYDFQTLF